MRILAVALLFACSPKADKQPAPAQLDKLEVAIDGKRIAIDRAFLRHLSPDVFGVVLGAGKGSCTEDGNLGFTITKRLATTGHESYVITDLYSRDHDLKLGEPIKVTLAGTKLALPRATMGKLVMGGEADLVDCPAPAPTGVGVPKVTPKSTGKIIVAGKALAIRGVTVQTRAGVAATDLPNITISTNLKDCSSVTLPAPVILERIDTKWSMRGTWFEGTLEGAAGDLAFNANAFGKTVDGPTLELQLFGSAKLGDYTVKLEGKAEAIECVR
ncbi:MAG: hypothetical protein M4D80_34965 [Myxococcota bacterium]|nr:hypothetical protein [Deltaproteobacteria bacterium]MDQ3340389.1 hypothetical protein [Myxococcota bacterium]